MMTRTIATTEQTKTSKALRVSQRIASKRRVEPAVAPALLVPLLTRRSRLQVAGDELVAFRDACGEYARALRRGRKLVEARGFEQAVMALDRYVAMPHPLPQETLRRVSARLRRFSDTSSFSDGLKEARGVTPPAVIEPVAQVLAYLNPPLRFFTPGGSVVAREDSGRWRRVTASRALGMLRAWVKAGALEPAIQQPLVEVSGDGRGGVRVYEEQTDRTSGDTILFPLLDGADGLHGEKRPDIETWALSLTEQQDERLLHHLAEQDPLRIAVTDEHDWLDADPPWLLGTPAGVYDLRTGERASNQPKLTLRMTDKSPADVADETTCPRFLAALERALPDAAERDYLQLLCGYALTGAYSADVAIMFLGPSRTGKSTVTEALRHAFGARGGYVAEVKNEGMLRSSKRFPQLSELRDKRLGIITELDRRYSWDAGRFKALTGGGHQAGRWSGGLEVDFDWQPQFTLLIETNETPKFGSTVGIAERLRVFEFNQRIADEDSQLRADMPTEEADGILRWLMDGARRFAADPRALQHRRAPASIRQATQAVLAGDDPEQTFYDSLQPAQVAVPFSALYDHLERMCVFARRPVPSRKAVAARLRADGYDIREGRGHQRVVAAEATCLVGQVDTADEGD